MSNPAVAVLRQNVHGMSVTNYVHELEGRLPEGIDVVQARTPEEERSILETARVAAGLDISADAVRSAADLELFACSYAGADHLPLETLEAEGVAVTTASGVHAPNVAEYAIGAVLSFVRDFSRARDRARNREWRHFQADELRGSTVSIVGLGSIGRAIATRLEPFGVRTIGVRYSSEKGGPTDEVIGFDDVAFHDALSRTDYLVLSCPLTDVTRSLIGSDELRTLPPEALLVNVARGEVVDTGALVATLRANGIRGAALDVTDPEPLPADHPLWTFENVRITPHNAGHTPKYWARLAAIVADNVERLDASDELRNRVV